MASGYLRKLESGRIQAVYYTGRGKTRRPHSRTFERDQRTLAKRWLTEMKSQVDRGEWRDPAGARTPFGAWVVTWQASRVTQPTTADTERHALSGWILPTFGDRPLGDITPVMVQGWVHKMTAHPLSPATIRRYKQLLCQILAAAADNDLIVRSPCRRIRLPKPAPQRTPVILAPTRVPALLDACDDAGRALLDPASRTLILTMLGTGLRWQEACWLRRRDVDLLRRELTVREVLKDATKQAGGRQGGAPKSLAGQRTLPLPDAVVTALAAHLPRGGEPNDVVFTSPRGDVWHRSNFGRRRLTPAALVAGVPDLEPHDLRRTYASWLHDGGVPWVVIQELLGHTHGGGVTGLYTHALPDVRRRVLTVLDAALGTAVAEGRATGD